MRILFTSLLLVLLSLAAIAQSEFNQPWKDKSKALVIDPYEKNPIDWKKLQTDKRVIGIIHRATIGFRVDKKYEEREIKADELDYLWGSYHLGRPGDPIKQAEFYLKTIGDHKGKVLVLDLENVNNGKFMNLADAKIFLKHIKDKIGRYPFVYANHSTTKQITKEYRDDEVYSQTSLWYARFRKQIPKFPTGLWDTYTFWQFSSEINCKPKTPKKCLYRVPGTKSDMDINVYNGNAEELRAMWTNLK